MKQKLDEYAFEWYYFKCFNTENIQKKKENLLLWTTVVVPRQE